MGEVRCDKPRERDAQSVLSGFLAIRDSRWRLQAVLLTTGSLTNDSQASMFSAVLTIKSMHSFVHTARIFVITHFMIFIAHACVKDSFVRMGGNFKWCKYTELDYTAHKISAFLCLFFDGTCYQSVEHMLLVNRRMKNSRKLCIFLLEVTKIEN